MAFKYRDVVIAHMDGKVVQLKCAGTWRDIDAVDKSLLYTYCEDHEYRIKPTKKTVWCVYKKEFNRDMFSTKTFDSEAEVTSYYKNDIVLNGWQVVSFEIEE